jgi:deoxyribodipyrimidine photo-lyase
MADDGTSRLSPYLHFGCLSPREIETLLPDTAGAAAWHRQLAWREFYHYIIYKFPDNAHHEFQEKYRQLKWSNDKNLQTAWETGQTGYPVVDAAMRQLHQEGWMHNRARLIVGSFLTKDLWLDWRIGEAYFMRMLLDGDEANNNGNWQWIASVGVDPAPVYRRLYNPSSQQNNYDPDGAYVRRYVPEMREVPQKFLAEPWTMSPEEQAAAHCLIGKDYPSPIIDHKQARQAALDRYRAV